MILIQLLDKTVSHCLARIYDQDPGIITVVMRYIKYINYEAMKYMARPKTDFTNVKCSKCGRSDLTSKTAYREYKKQIWTGRWLCNKCYVKDYQDETRKPFTARRMGDLNFDSPGFKGDLFEELTDRWRGIKNLNEELNNYRTPIDHSRDPELGIVQTKGATKRIIRRLYGLYDIWQTDFRNELGKEFDNLIFYCADNEMQNIERIYIFPVDIIYQKLFVSIFESDAGWYRAYRIKDIEIIKKVNEIFRTILKEKGIIL
jgi:hypothetical protein